MGFQLPLKIGKPGKNVTDKLTTVKSQILYTIITFLEHIW